MKQPNNAPPRLIAARAACKEFGIKYGTLRDIVHRGEIPVLRIGGQDSSRAAWYFDRVDIEGWIDATKKYFPE